MREQFGGASAAQPGASPAIRSLCWFASRRATDEKQRAAGTSGRQATGDTPRGRPGSCSAAARAPAPPATARRLVHASACREARRDDARASRMRELGPESKRQEKKGTYGLGARGWGLCTSKIRSRSRRLKNTQSEGPAREPLTVQAPRRLARASTFSPSVLVLGGEFLKRGEGGWGRIGMGWRGLVIVTAGGVPRYLGQSLAPSIGSSRLPAIVGQLFSSASALLSFFFGRWMEPSTGHTPRHHPFSASI